MCEALGERWGVVSEAFERKVDGKWGVGGFTDEACMWSFRTVQLACEIPPEFSSAHIQTLSGH